MKISTCLVVVLLAAESTVDASASTMELRLVVDCKLDHKSVVLKNTGEMLCLSGDVIADLSEVVSTEAGNDPHMDDVSFVRINLNARGAENMKAVTTAHVFSRIGIVLNGELISASTVMEPLSNSLQISFPAPGNTTELAATYRSLAGLKP